MGRDRTARRRGRAGCWVLLATGLSVMVVAGGSLLVPEEPVAVAVAGSPPVPVPAEIPPVGLMAPSVSAHHPAASSSSPAQRKPSAGQSSEPTTSQVSVGTDLQPSNLSIEAIEVNSTLRPLGLNADGSLEVPARGPSYDDAGWFTGSPIPGESGPAILLGHVNGRGGVPSVFFRLAELREGDLVSVGLDDASQNVFEVYRVEQYPKDQFPTTTVYGDTTRPELRLITCAGAWDAETSHYRDNTVVYAQEISTG